jgi:4-amino-4-deoxy-L-arabinose transferase-like glycosyltransferase
MPRLSAHICAWIAIIAVALGVRLAVGVWWQSRLPPDRRFFFGDSDSYWVLGQAIARGEPYQYGTSDRRVFRTPGYPVLLAGMFLVLGDDAPVMAARALGAVLGVVSVALVGWWATWLFDARAGRYAGWIAALYPGAVAMGAFVLTEAPFTPLMLAQLALWGLAWRSESNARAALLGLAAGAAAGAATLVRPSWLLFVPFALGLALAFDRRRGRQALVGAAVVGGLVAVMLPWWIHNFRVTGRFVATSLQAGAGLYDGWNPEAEGGSNMAYVEKFTEMERAAPVKPGDDVFEVRLDRRMSKAATDWAREHPRRVLELAWIKFLRMWNVWPNEPSMRSWPLALAVFLTYTPLLILSVIGAWRFSKLGWPYAIAWLPAVYLTLMHMVFVGSIRYREPAMVALIVLAAGVLAMGRGPAGDGAIDAAGAKSA